MLSLPPLRGGPLFTKPRAATPSEVPAHPAFLEHGIILSPWFPGDASILDFRPRFENRCKVFPVYTLLRASILDFRPRLGNRCSGE
ncbi:MAG: hypothetical protein SOV31_03440 [Candidatus Cryptobacteroides sp.]|nr:hypothetical protein [Candidatus Cryptobacteroides sp.]